MDKAKRALETACELGASTLLVCSNTSVDALDGIERSAAQLSALADRAAADGVKIAFEALSWGTHIRTYRVAWEIVQCASHQNLGLCLDTFHICALEEDLSAIETIARDQIVLVQIADALPARCDLKSWSRHLRCLPGEGILPIFHMFRQIKETGY